MYVCNALLSHSQDGQSQTGTSTEEAWDHVKSLYQTSAATCLFGKNNVHVQPVSSSPPSPHTTHCLTHVRCCILAFSHVTMLTVQLLHFQLTSLFHHPPYPTPTLPPALLSSISLSLSLSLSLSVSLSLSLLPSFLPSSTAPPSSTPHFPSSFP